MFNKKFCKDLIGIAVGGALYALSIVLFIFPHDLLLGGTAGISVILNYFIPAYSPGTILMVINFTLLFLAFLILGKEMAVKTLIGSTLTTLMVGALEKILVLGAPIIPNLYLSSAVGAAIIAVASGLMFYVDSSSGGTDIVALIVRKFSSIRIGRALLLTDVLIVIVGGIISGWALLISSFLGLLIKTLGIDVCISFFRKLQNRTK